jgi:NADH-quinone oxidoreductase subunit N
MTENMLTDILILLKQELIIVVIIFLLLFIKLGSEWKNESIIRLVNILLFINLAAGLFGNIAGVLFGEMYHTGKLVVLEKSILNLALLIVSLLAYPWLRKQQQVIEFYILLLSSLLGMFFMISAGNLLQLYLGLELSTLPLAAAANFDLHKRKSAEAAMKLIFSSAFASALLLLGISWMYGMNGSVDFSVLAQQTNHVPFALFAFILVIAGFAFKVSAVPFHLWTADVYEGAPVAVTAFLAVASKAAVLFVLVQIFYQTFTAFSDIWYPLLYILSLLSIIIGNLFALRQNNFKRFLAFSSIAQVGFILLGISGSSDLGTTAVVYFILIYLFSNLAAFGVVLLAGAEAGKENIDDFKGFYQTNPLLTWVLTIALFSLAGVPPTAGFFGKFFLLFAGAAKGNYWLIAIAAINMVVSFYYYLRIVKTVFMDKSETPMQKLSIPFSVKWGLYICLAGIIVTGVAGMVYNYIYSISSGI